MSITSIINIISMIDDIDIDSTKGPPANALALIAIMIRMIIIII